MDTNAWDLDGTGAAPVRIVGRVRERAMNPDGTWRATIAYLDRGSTATIRLAAPLEHEPHQGDAIAVRGRLHTGIDGASVTPIKGNLHIAHTHGKTIGDKPNWQKA